MWSRLQTRIPSGYNHLVADERLTAAAINRLGAPRPALLQYLGRLETEQYQAALLRLTQTDDAPERARLERLILAYEGRQER